MVEPGLLEQRQRAVVPGERLGPQSGSAVDLLETAQVEAIDEDRIHLGPELLLTEVRCRSHDREEHLGRPEALPWKERGTATPSRR